MSESTRCRVLIADDHPLLRTGLKLLVEHEDDMEVVAEARDGREAVELATRYVPDVVIMDVQMPGLTGIEATRRIRGAKPSVNVLIVSAEADGEVVDEAVVAGANGFVAKDAGLTTIIAAIRHVCAREPFLAVRG